MGFLAGEKAVRYRRINRLSDDSGTAVTVQRMVYGNAGGTSGAGVGFTRDPASGERSLYLDFLFNTQGEDIVSGQRNAPDGALLGTVLPSVLHELRRVARLLEEQFHDMQEFEFTVQDGKLYVLQTRTGKRTPWAALRIVVDQVDEGMIDEASALERLSNEDIGRIARSRIVASTAQKRCRGVPAGIGVATGEIALDPGRVQELARSGRDAILVRDSMSTEDIAGIEAATGVLAARGSRTAHAAVVARQMNKPCIVGCPDLSVDLPQRRCSLAGRWLSEGEVLSIDGQSGDVYVGPVTVELEKPVEYVARVARWRASRAAA